MESSKGSAQPVSLEDLFKSKNVSVGTMTASLFRNRKSGTVMYLEAGKDFADILLSLLLLPVGTIIHLLSKGIHVKPALGGLVSIYESVQSFDTSDLQVAKDNLMQPRPPAIHCSCRSDRLQLQAALAAISILPSPFQISLDYYKCDNCQALIPTLKGNPCWACCPKRTGPGYKCNRGPYLAFEEDRHPSIAGLVTRDSTYIIADNLEIMHLTTNNTVIVLNKMNVSSLHDLEGIDITITITQSRKRLQSFHITQTLYDMLQVQVCNVCGVLFPGPAVTPIGIKFKDVSQ